jgi:acyl dehydratase/NAD(P)-dependent dehydrogenase (short-subunit alcohol dehydrogenase family)
MDGDLHSSEERTFTLSDQEAFASLSGDRNPIHVDPIAARRLQFGEPVVHGMHLVLQLLDGVSRRLTRPYAVRTVSAKFHSPVLVGQVATFVHSVDAENVCSAKVISKGRLAMRLTAALGSNASATDIRSAAVDGDPPTECRERSMDAIQIEGGDLPLVLDRQLFAAMFPGLAQTNQATQAAVLAAISRLVGMECPGLHSLLGSLEVELSDNPGRKTLGFRVHKVDRRYRLVQIELTGVARGAVDAFVRLPPVRQPSSRALSSLVRPQEFKKHRALIVGGSRGLGETCAKLLALGGADVTVTYALGTEDAHSVVRDIRSNDGRAEAIFYDVLAPPERTAASFSLCCFFASPQIKRSPARSSFDSSLFQMYCRFYVQGLGDLIAWLGPHEAVSVLYPSTFLIDTPETGFAEYASAKAAGEVLCRDLALRHKKIRIAWPRLPRLRTDQTQALQSKEIQAPESILLPALRLVAAA